MITILYHAIPQIVKPDSDISCMLHEMMRMIVCSLPKNVKFVRTAYARPHPSAALAADTFPKGEGTGDILLGII